MRLSLIMLAVLPVVLQLDPARGQGIQWSLPSGASALDPMDPGLIEDAGQAAAAAAAGQNILVPQMQSLPTAPVIPNSAGTFSEFRQVARLQRGNKVLEISNEALRNSGVYEKAIASSPQLARSFQVFESRTLQRQQTEFMAQSLDMRLSAQGDDQNAKAQNKAMQNATAAANQARAAQQIAAQNFESQLWNIGFKGGKVASVTSTQTAGSESGSYVLVEAMSNRQSDNLGYTQTQIRKDGTLGFTTVPSEYLLPLPQDPNDPFFNQVLSATTQRSPDGVMLMLTDEKPKNPILQFLATPRFGAFYDTGFLEGEKDVNFAQRVSLQSRRAPPAGQYDFFQLGEKNINIPLDLGLNMEIMDVGGGQSAQFFVTADNNRVIDNLDVDTVGVRAYNRRRGSFFEGWSVIAGKKQSIFGEIALRPTGLGANTSLIGTVDRSNNNLPQLAIHAPLTDMISWKVAMEDRYDADLFTLLPESDRAKLNRWPTLANCLTFTDPVSDNTLHLASVIRTIGFQNNATSVEDFTTGWGLSAIAKFRTGNSANFVGVAGGNGVGDYIRGNTLSSISDADSISPLSAIGAFAGRQTVWLDRCQNPVAEFNAAYGYGQMESPVELLGTTDEPNRKYHQAWMNFTKLVNDQVGVGAEYQYGFRKLFTGDVGENHRVGFFVMVRTSPTKKESRASEFTQLANFVAPSAPSGGDSPFTLPGDPPAEAPPVSLAAPAQTGATLGVRSLGNVVNQFQLGGAAHRQGL